MEKVTQKHPESLLLRLGNWKYVMQRQNSWIGEGWGKGARENPSTHSPLLQMQLEQLPQPPAGWTVWWGNEKTPETKRRSPPHTAIRSDIIFFFFFANSPFPRKGALLAGVLKTLSFHHHAWKLLSLADTSPSCPVCQHNWRLRIMASLSMPGTKAKRGHSSRNQTIHCDSKTKANILAWFWGAGCQPKKQPFTGFTATLRFPWGNLPLCTCLPFVKLKVANLLSLRSFNPAMVPQPQPELPQPCSASTTHLATGGPSPTWPSSAGSSWATVGSPFALLHSKNSSSAWENHSLPCTVLKAAMLLAHYLPFVHGEVTWLISEHQIPRRRNY